jgi:hypothetical protein
MEIAVVINDIFIDGRATVGELPIVIIPLDSYVLRSWDNSKRSVSKIAVIVVFCFLLIGIYVVVGIVNYTKGTAMFIAWPIALS